MATTASSGMSGKTNGLVSWSMSTACDGAARGLGLGRSEHLQVELFIEFGDFALCRSHQEFRGHADEDAVIAGGVVTQGISQLLGHEAGIAGGGEQMFEAGQEFLAGGDAGGGAGTDARA